MVTIYHNNRCSKSRQTLDLLREKGEELQVVEYLKNTPSAEELKAVLQKLGLQPEQVLRKGEQVYKENFAGKSYTDEEWLQIMAEHPILIERPIVVKGDRATIGRPPEKVLDIL
ncbi:arsenate reductase (glutaredoxin) [Pontibacter amylolyticus]|uniref:Arsenate reductase (Glutaredoxin) n=1 Tax=Pontibacter amylolyticus TaxID=1424080 RepID=A0ABQ1W833_9BACT|nr:arsenate reductase (glutaredoxin) [Pontibacter amylolyticus]GGG16048.1 arsenate reductase (glutaredoxin) [Pontibacter amylolyticus]